MELLANPKQELYSAQIELKSEESPELSDAASISITVGFAVISIACIIVLMVLITIRRDVQPLKIKSPRLILLSMLGNLIIIFSVCIIQVTEEQCINIQTVKKS